MSSVLLDTTWVAEWAVGLWVRSLLLVLLAGVVAGCLRRTSAAKRCLTWQALTLGLVVLPVVLAAAPSSLIPVTVPNLPFPAALDTVTTFRKSTVREPVRKLPFEGEPLAADSGKRRTARNGDGSARVPSSRWSSFPWTLWLLGLWGAGVLLLTLRTVRALGAARRIVKGSRPAGAAAILEEVNQSREVLGLRRPVRVLIGLEGGGAKVPMLFGLREPCVLLPSEAETWPVATLRSVLLHELAHVDRSDWFWLLAARWTAILYWPNPFVAWAAIQLKRESEAAADDRVLEAGVKPSDYATHLLEVLPGHLARAALPATVLAMARAGEIPGRLSAILSTRVERSQAKSGAVWFARVLVPVLLLMLGSISVRLRGGGQAGGLVVRSPERPSSDLVSNRFAGTGTASLGQTRPGPVGPVSLPVLVNPGVKPGSHPSFPRRPAGSRAERAMVGLLPTVPVLPDGPVQASDNRESHPGRFMPGEAKGSGTLLVGGYTQEAARWQVYGFDLARDALEVLIPEGGLQVSTTRDLRTITYSREQDGEAHELWVRPAGGASRRLMDGLAAPVWSPDGTQFVCSRWVPDGEREGRWETHRFAADGSRGERLPLPDDVSVQDWDPRGRSLLVIAQTRSGDTRIETVRPDGNERTVLLQGRRFKQPRYSPDGSRILFVALWNPAAGQPDDEVWLYDPATRREQRVFSEAGVIPAACWSPNGRQVALVTVRSQLVEQGRRIDGHTYRMETIDPSGANRRMRAHFPWMARVGAPVWVE